MFLAITAGLSGRVDELFRICRAWEHSASETLSAVLQLGDLPLRHDFSRGRSQRTGSAVAALVHRRQSPAYPVVFLAGEQDDAALLQRFAPSVHRSSADRASHDRTTAGEPGGAGTLQPSTQSPGGLSYLAAGSVISVSGRSESVPVAGLSAFGAASPKGVAASQRTEIRRLLALSPRSVPILISHDSPESVLAARSDASPESSANARDRDTVLHPGAFFLKVLDALQPEVAFYGHAAELSVTRHGASTLVSMPPCRAEGDSPVVMILSTADWSLAQAQAPGAAD